MGATHRHEKMRAITHCPVCQTQFFVSEQQLDQHHGQVRCGHCLHVFDAKAHSVEPLQPAASDATDFTAATPVAAAIASELIAAYNQDSTFSTTEVSAHLAADAAAIDFPAPPPTAVTEVAIATAMTDVTSVSEALTSIDQPFFTPAPILAVPTLEHELPADVATENVSAGKMEADTNPVAIVTDAVSVDAVAEAEAQADPAQYFDYLTEPQAAMPSKPLHIWLSRLFVFILLLLAIMQSMYFLRNPIAIYYPNIKPYLQQACHKLGCSIDLPKKIELIIIDDSDMQEDADHAGLIDFKTTLINQAGFHQAYPNVELTLTDLDDKPTLRRLFKPREYLPATTNIDAGIAPAEAVSVKLKISVTGMPVAGYRVFVTY